MIEERPKIKPSEQKQRAQQAEIAKKRHLKAFLWAILAIVLVFHNFVLGMFLTAIPWAIGTFLVLLGVQGVAQIFRHY